MQITITMCNKYQVWTSDIWLEIPRNEYVINETINKYIQEKKTFYVNHMSANGKCLETIYFEKGVKQS